jgi:acyl-CoA oxidase
MGRDAIDNGWIKFTNVRIPRQFMLMKYTKVDNKGNVKQPPLAQLTYGALIGGRVSMAADSFHWAKRFLTISIRYAAARRQFASTEGSSETKLLDYTYHQRRLLPRLAYAYAMKAGADELYELYWRATKTLDDVDQSDKVSLTRAIEDVKELFQVSAGLKAFSTWGTQDIIDQCRQACGGHGYSGYNGFGQGYNDWVVQCTWEGDNNVLTLSAGRALIQSGLALRKGKAPGSALTYLSRSAELKGKTLGARDIRSPDVIIEGWQVVSSQAINNAVEKYIELTEKKGYGQVQAFEELSQQRFEIARIHTRLYLINAFYERINHQASGDIKKALLDVAGLFSLWSLENEGSLFLKYGFITAQDLDVITSHVNEYCRVVREQAVGLTDAFNLSDFFINAPIGNYDGDVYRHYFDKVIRRNPPRDDKAPYHDRVLKPFLNREEEEEHDLDELYPED